MEAKELNTITKESEAYLDKLLKTAYSKMKEEAENGKLQAWIDRPQTETQWDYMVKILSEKGYKIENQSGNSHLISWNI